MSDTPTVLPGLLAIDFESYYDNVVSAKPLGQRGYFEHPRFDAYLVTVYGFLLDGTLVNWAGHPTEFDWASIAGEGYVWISHNAAFDANLYRSLVNKGTLAPLFPEEWNCTADMAAYCGLPRSLANACRVGLGIDVSKETRSLMKGQRWEDMSEEFQKEVLEYATLDSLYCYMLWATFSDRWPEHERRLSRLTYDMGWEGVPVDKEGLETSVALLKERLAALERDIPWVNEPKAPLMSPKRLAAWCDEKGIPGPPSTSGVDPAAEEWMAKYPGTPLEALITIRRINKLLKSIEAMQRRVIGSRLHYELKYFGAHTGRDSGGGGWNSQNIPRVELFGVNVRSLIKADRDHMFVISDLSQIEPRCLHYLARDWELLDWIRRIGDAGDVYEAQARSWGMWTKDEPLKGNDDALRHKIKTCSLGLGYGTGWSKFATIAKIPPAEARQLVNFYRKKNPKILALWKMLDQGLKRSALRKETFEVTLPSGRSLLYRDPKDRDGEVTATIMRNGAPMRVRLWGSAIAENVTQALARDVFMANVLALKDAGYKVIMRIHDEVVVEIPRGSDEEMSLAAKEVRRIMSTAPGWISQLPLNAGGEVSEVYKK